MFSLSSHTFHSHCISVAMLIQKCKNTHGVYVSVCTWVQFSLWEHKNKMLPLSKREKSPRQSPVRFLGLFCLKKFRLVTSPIHPSCFTEQEADTQRSSGLFTFTQHSEHWAAKLCFFYQCTLSDPLSLFQMLKDIEEHVSLAELKRGKPQFSGLIFQVFVGL